MLFLISISVFKKPLIEYKAGYGDGSANMGCHITGGEEKERERVMQHCSLKCRTICLRSKDHNPIRIQNPPLAEQQQATTLLLSNAFVERPLAVWCSLTFKFGLWALKS
ncbi:hypothetical protein FRX31_035378 [Thalictrum thalictroides]|uniref:Uncharacterized protein n=1 Tax=Thalictrum thalictroides TaxID=46969 RepID=A0A7J6US14_THATH|nr:hypothetical protein FRX31_035378 [Thalictrum thalictroides]